jgi:hypothetical protein
MKTRASPPRALNLATAALLFGCSQALCHTMPIHNANQEPSLEFTVAGSAEAGAAEELKIAGVSPGEIVLGGVIATPNPCYDIDAAVALEDGTLTLTLTATARPGFCAQVVGALRYDATLGGLQPGAYDLVVVHQYPETGWEQRVFRQQATVPDN